ncbi:MAG: hypothetical protein HWQ38_19085 [Nostoc sp. NMS7]|uniref:hypothetical protein n=1 Tax=Nostoc sp. NMS7 TaxID=2815391 RepID=UPI0025DF5CCB|nr:hypothetical protein [Nostoc sp. NMS7]MBN3948441.1 hypothetical protein [Nostoc sp. NMS7]
MPRLLGYWTNFTLSDNSLLSEMEQLWGSQLQGLSNAERLWMIQKLAYYLWLGVDESVSDRVKSLTEDTEVRIPDADKLGLIQALVEQLKGC